MTPVLSFDTFQKLDLPLSEIVSGRIGFIHDLFLCFPYEICDELPTGNQDLVVITGKDNRGDKLRQLGEYPGRVLLVLAPGDASFRASYMPGRLGLPPNIVAAFVTNNEHPDRRVINIPLGVRSSNLKPLQFVRQNHDGGRDRLLYGNFTVNDDHYPPDPKGSRHIRSTLVERLRGERWATLDISADKRDTVSTLIQYYSEISRHRFVLSPRGHGIDCYRTWEALQLGAIPIVTVSPVTTSFASLPILFTEDYSELSQDYLGHQWKEMSQRDFDFSSLFKAYYRQQFLERVATLINPRFVCWGFRGTPNEKFHRVLERSSHSPADVTAETPTRPFAPPGLNLMDPSSWNIRNVDLTKSGNTIRLTASGDGRMIAKFPLNTIPGGPFRLTGRVRSESEGASPLLFSAVDKSQIHAKRKIQAGEDDELILDFVADANRTLLVIEMTAPSAWLLSDLEVSATV
jgi:hypothetical protein